jgi:hypothetical protein
MGGHWQWRCTWEQVPPDIAARIRELLQSGDRLPPALGAPAQHEVRPAESGG